MSNTFEDPETRAARWTPRANMMNGMRRIGRQALALIGLLLVILSIPIGFVTPFLPIGLPVGIFGSALLARNSVWGQRLIRYLLTRYPKLKKVTPDWLMKLILGQEENA